MTAEAQDRGLANELITNVGNEIERALTLRRVERVPTFSGRLARARGALRGSVPMHHDIKNISFAERDFTGGEFLRRSAARGNFFYEEGHNRQVQLRLSELKDGTRRILIWDVATLPGNYPPDPKIGGKVESQVVVLKREKDGDSWRVTRVKKEEKSGERFVETTESDPSPFDALDRAMDFARVVLDVVPSELSRKIEEDEREQMEIARLLD